MGENGLICFDLNCFFPSVGVKIEKHSSLRSMLNLEQHYPA